MKINFLYTTNLPQFKSNFNSPKLRFKPTDFYINIKGYGRDANWAEKIIQTADEATKFIRKNWFFENVIKKISIGVTEANRFPLDVDKRQHTGILRTAREGWRHGSEWDDFELTTDYGKNGNKKYNIYESRLDEVVKKPLRNPYKDISLTYPKIDEGEKYLLHGDSEKINNAFRYIEKLYNFLQKKYINTELKPKDLKVINNIIAQIRWLMAHATPWERGSDAISNVFMKSLYKALGIKTYEPAKGVSFDMEAYCTDLRTYKKNFTSYFKFPPEIVR